MIEGNAPMNVSLAKALAALLPAGILFSGSAVLFSKAKTPPTFLQLVGAGGLVLVVFTHICEALQLLPWMHWGLEDSAGHCCPGA
jgi:hypothetical protein